MAYIPWPLGIRPHGDSKDDKGVERVVARLPKPGCPQCKQRPELSGCVPELDVCVEIDPNMVIECDNPVAAQCYVCDLDCILEVLNE